MKSINKLFVLLSAVFAMAGFSSCSEEIDYTPAEPVDPSCPAVRFAAANESFFEIDPASPQFTVTLERNATDAATYSLAVTRNDENAFVVPANVTFEAGQKEATVVVGLAANAPTATDLTVSFGIDEAYVNPYINGLPDYTGTVNIVKWNTVGVGQWLDGFWWGFWDEVTIQYRDDIPSLWRINNPYVDELGGGGTYEKYLYFTLNEDGTVTWDKWFFINTMYDEGLEIKAYLPSALSASLASTDATSYAEYDEDGNMLYWQINPYWYVDGMGGWGAKYPCYLAFPGVDLATEWEW